MLNPIHTLRPLAAERSPWLRGTLAVPGDEVLAHLALVAGAAVRGTSRIEGALGGARLAATARALAALGAALEPDDRGWTASGLGPGGLLAPERMLDLGDSALGLALIAGLVAPHDFETQFIGSPELFGRPFTTLIDAFATLGTRHVVPERKLPVTLRGPRIATPGIVAAPPGLTGARAALLMAALGTPGLTTIVDRHPGWNHDERLLRGLGAEIDSETTEAGAEVLHVRGLPALRAGLVDIPGDTGLAAVGAVAASIVPGSEVRTERVLVNPRRTALLSALVAMGASIEVQDLRIEGGEEVADLVARHATLAPVALGVAHVAPLLDELPLLAVAAANADGETTFHLPANLPLLTYARVDAIAKALRANGVSATASEEALVVRGGPVRGGGRVHTDGDAVMGMAFLVLGMAAGDQVTIDDQTGIEGRFPGFVAAFEEIGAGFVHYSD